ncbi:MAG: TonB-dependent receptor, partial [Bryobacteraceae bacterium]|nr:TonB-dependent receptor [Bryobacteraceae bacterium]
EYIVDGISAGTGMLHDVVRTTPTMEVIAEFKVITNGISSEYGRLSGGAVEVVTRGGTNSPHGELFNYMQNDAFNANSWLQNSLGGRKAHFTQNIYGGTFGGPVVLPKLYNGRNKTFFLFNYEGQKRREAGRLITRSVPTEAERNGDFSQTVYNGISPTFYDQDGPVNFDNATNSWIREQLLGDGKRIPAGRINPVSKALLRYVPLPNRAPNPGTSMLNNFVAPESYKKDSWMYGVRLDHQFTPSHRFFGRYASRKNEDGSTRAGGPANTANSSNQIGGFGATLNYDWTVSPTLLLNARAGVNFNPNTTGNLLDPTMDTSDIPWDPETRRLLNGNLPITGVSYADITQTGGTAVTNNTTYDTGLTMTRILNRHTIRYGVQHRRYFDNLWNSGNGTFRFMANPVHRTAGVDFGYGSDLSNAYAMGAFLAGVNNRANVTAPTTRANNFNYYAAFIQDDFKLARRLTLNLGLRWDMESPVTERFDKLYMWDPDAPSPFRINAGYDFAAELRKAGLDPATVRTPSWVTSGFRNGAIRVANTPEYNSRNATMYRPWQFAPRLGLAWQLNEKTVVRSSFGQMFISTSGAAGAFSTGGSGIRLADGADAGWHASFDNMVHMRSNYTTPWAPSDVSAYQRTTAAANLQATGPVGPSAFNRASHMPYEWTWSLGVQRELPHGFLVEMTYSANAGRDLLGPDIQARFPRELFNGGAAGQNSRIYTTQIASPTAGQTLNNSVVGLKQNVGILEMDYPYFGAMAVQGSNIGTSNFHSGNLRVERRLRQGMFFLINYTISKSLDDVGGPDTGTGTGISGMNTGGKRVQTVDNTPSVYGFSPLDERHVFRATYNVEIPIGHGKAILGTPNSFGAKALDFAFGGWEFAGTGILRSGRPVVFDATTPNINNNVRVEWTYGSFAGAGTSVSNARFGDPRQVFYSQADARLNDRITRFDNVVDAQRFTYGTLSPVFGDLRHPGRTNYDLSLMKAFYFSSERKQYLQLRMEGTNIFNIRGFGSYNTKIGTRDFGLITAPGNTERRIQMSARIVF